LDYRNEIVKASKLRSLKEKALFIKNIVGLEISYFIEASNSVLVLFLTATRTSFAHGLHFFHYFEVL
jgi:hypothetical protein